MRRLQRLARREFWSLLAFTAAFVAAAVALALYLPSNRAPGAATVLLLIGAYAAAFGFQFEVASGTAVPTQLILVPMLFLLPSGSVPLAVGGGILLGSSVECLRGRLHLERLVLRILNASYAIGPALVLGLAGESAPNLQRWPLYLAALAAQFALDFAVTAARQWITLGVPPRIHLRAMSSVYVIDAGLAPVGPADHSTVPCSASSMYSELPEASDVWYAVPSSAVSYPPPKTSTNFCEFCGGPLMFTRVIAGVDQVLPISASPFVVGPIAQRNFGVVL